MVFLPCHKKQRSILYQIDHDTFMFHDTEKKGLSQRWVAFRFGDSFLSTQDKTRQIQDYAQLFRKQLLHKFHLPVDSSVQWAHHPPGCIEHSEYDNVLKDFHHSA